MNDAFIDAIFPHFQEIRRTIHANPELRYEEHQTAQLVTAQLREMDLKVMTHIGQTGVVGILDTGRPGKTVGLRADMDGLPMTEATELPYASKVPGKMHACGHDGHTATLLATAKVLSEHRDQLIGKVKFIFQPAEEGGAGAKAMIEDGVLTDPPMDVIFAFHNHPSEPVGTVLAKTGSTMYGNTEFYLTIEGKGGHAAQPETVINPMYVGSRLIEAVQVLLAELTQDPEPAVITVTQFNSGFATNIVPDQAQIVGTIRAPTEAKSQFVVEQLTALIQRVETETQAQIKTVINAVYPPTINTETETALVLAKAKEILGADRVKLKPRLTRASEDFSFFLQQIPDCYFFLGNGTESACCHSNRYDFADELIKVGTKVMTGLVAHYLKK